MVKFVFEISSMANDETRCVLIEAKDKLDAYSKLVSMYPENLYKVTKFENPCSECNVNECSMFCERVLESMDCDAKEAQPGEVKDLKEIGRLDYLGSEYHAGEKRMKDKAIKAAKEVIDEFYNSNFNPTIDYLGLFIEKLEQ